MNYHLLLDVATELGYQLAMSGAEIFRIEESVNRTLAAYGLTCEAYAIPNCLTVSVKTPDGNALTRMKRIGIHGNDLDSVERYSNLSRRICALKPDPQTANQWLSETTSSRVKYRTIVLLVGNFLGAFGFAIIFGGTLADSIFSGVCGFFVGLVNLIMSNLKVNQFFSTIAAAFIMAFAAHAIGAAGLTTSTDTVVIGALMLLVPGLIFTNAMRDIIYGDTNSGINRIVQVLMIAAAIAIGTGTAWNLAHLFFDLPIPSAALAHPIWLQCIACFVGCSGFAILFNIHGPGGLLCALGGVITWATYLICTKLATGEYTAYFVSALVAAVYSEIMARVRKYPAISYLVVSIFPLIPGAGIYYASNFITLGDTAGFAAKGMQTIGIAGAIAVGILSISTLVRLNSVWCDRRH